MPERQPVSHVRTTLPCMSKRNVFDESNGEIRVYPCNALGSLMRSPSLTGAAFDSSLLRRVVLALALASLATVSGLILPLGRPGAVLHRRGGASAPIASRRAAIPPAPKARPMNGKLRILIFVVSRSGLIVDRNRVNLRRPERPGQKNLCERLELLRWKNITRTASSATRIFPRSGK